jgi:alcohol dehydrogenase, propanol-preferring
MRVEDRGVKFPLTPGHEVAGLVEDTGETIMGFRKTIQSLFIGG